MEFEDMQRIWNSDIQQHQFVVDEAKVLESVTRKKDKAKSRLNRMEIFLSSVYLVVGSSMEVILILDQDSNIFLHMAQLLLIAFGIYILFRRMRRLKEAQVFERSIKGELDYAIYFANYQVSLSILGAVSAFPIFLMIWMGALYENKSLNYLIGIGIFFILAIIGAYWEHKSIHLGHRNRLIRLRESLLNG